MSDNDRIYLCAVMMPDSPSRTMIIETCVRLHRQALMPRQERRALVLDHWRQVLRVIEAERRDPAGYLSTPIRMTPGLREAHAQVLATQEAAT